MTNDDKRDLRRRIIAGDTDDKLLARRCGCTVGTVRKYRKALAPSSEGAADD